MSKTIAKSHSYAEFWERNRKSGGHLLKRTIYDKGYKVKEQRGFL